MNKLNRVTGCILFAMTILLSGCGGQQSSPAPKPEVGVINLQQAITEHPRYPELAALEEQRLTQREQLAVKQERELTAARQQLQLDLSSLNTAAEQEFQAKLEGKHKTFQQQLETKAKTLEAELQTQLDDYSREVDLTYQQQSFALQVRLQTLDLKEQEREELQAELQKLQQQRQQELAAYREQLAKRMQNEMKQAEQTANEQFAKYRKQLEQEIKTETERKVQTLQKQLSVKSATSDTVDLTKQLQTTEQAINNLHQEIMAAISQHAAAIAQQHGLHTVVVDPQVFTSAAYDITAEVIAAGKN